MFSTSPSSPTSTPLKPLYSLPTASSGSSSGSSSSSPSSPLLQAGLPTLVTASTAPTTSLTPITDRQVEPSSSSDSGNPSLQRLGHVGKETLVSENPSSSIGRQEALKKAKQEILQAITEGLPSKHSAFHPDFDLKRLRFTEDNLSREKSLVAGLLKSTQQKIWLNKGFTEAEKNELRTYFDTLVQEWFDRTLDAIFSRKPEQRKDGGSLLWALLRIAASYPQILLKPEYHQRAFHLWVERTLDGKDIEKPLWESLITKKPVVNNLMYALCRGSSKEISKENFLQLITHLYGKYLFDKYKKLIPNRINDKKYLPIFLYQLNKVSCYFNKDQKISIENLLKVQFKKYLIFHLNNKEYTERD